jgi:aminoglycoside phosphotransferase family enzyme/predicted kinase
MTRGEQPVGDIVADLRQGAEELIETHISWVMIGTHDVYKLKKPVNFGFLDFSDLESRRRACLAELELNSRLAPGIYLGVLPVIVGADGVHRIGPAAGSGASPDGASAPVVDHVVHMSRLPTEARVDLRLERGVLEAEDIDAIAALLARFHEGAAQNDAISEYGRIEVIRGNVEENFSQARELLERLVPAGTEREVEARQLAFIHEHAELFESRRRAGKVRDGHGDLRLEHVYLVSGREPVIIDCIEFNERFRFADVCADLAFLSMDLEMHGRHDLKERLLASYAAESGDYDLYALVDFYESYRAYVRAKVSAFSLASVVSFEAREKLEAETRRYLLLSLAAERPPLGAPRLLAVGGLIASGKSTLSRALGRRLGAPVIGSDETRKRLLGVPPTTALHSAPWQAAYGAETSERVYDEVLRRARVVIESGRTAVVDASFRSAQDRLAARSLARSLGAEFAFVECRVPEDVARTRLRARAQGPSVSDGRLEIFDEFVARYEPVKELAQGEGWVVDTRGTPEAALAALEGSGLSLDPRV